jgi:hypothetical protein
MLLRGLFECTTMATAISGMRLVAAATAVSQVHARLCMLLCKVVLLAVQHCFCPLCTSASTAAARALDIDLTSVCSAAPLIGRCLLSCIRTRSAFAQWISCESPRLAPFRTRTTAFGASLNPSLSPVPLHAAPGAPITGQDDLAAVLPQVLLLLLASTCISLPITCNCCTL